MLLATIDNHVGEMNEDQLWETTMNPENRTIRQIKVEDFKEADALIEILMGKDAAPRKTYISNHANDVEIIL